MSNQITQIAMSHAVPAGVEAWHVPAAPVRFDVTGKRAPLANRTYDPGSPSCRPPA